ncbi:unnamed protein product [Bursaphelenchus okinawaensis]|uniref:PDZ domain-containing protein n=1 Tax=Bursaphelenchus okinawaensis TaxID=465554 RepID=A0A811LNB4_9BILA|nr:unnamed protein product [Bursaphelenchus okinawaensis]CAG9124703.1 unnamed protein product [Bursaphelenchus okinawaensis]
MSRESRSTISKTTDAKSTQTRTTTDTKTIGKEEKKPSFGYGTKAPKLFEEKVVQATLAKADSRAVIVSSSLLVLKVEKDSPLAKMLDIGDYIFQINNVNLESKGDFYMAIKKAFKESSAPTINFGVRRPRWSSKQSSTNYERATGYEYLANALVTLPGYSTGMSIRAYHGKVFVNKVEPGSLAARSIRIGDCITAVDDTACTTVVQCMSVLQTALKRDRMAVLFIERPTTQTAMQVVKAALIAKKNNPFENKVAPDAKEIAQRQVEKIRSGNLKKAKPIYKKQDRTSQMGSAVKFQAHISASSKKVCVGADPFNPMYMAAQQKPSPMPTSKLAGSGSVGGIGSFD